MKPKFDELKRRYVEKLSLKINLMSEALNKGDEFFLADSFHKLKGNGKTYGFPIISEIGSILDNFYKKKDPQFLFLAHKAILTLQKLTNSYQQNQEMRESDVPEYFEIIHFVNSQKKGTS